MNRWLDARRVLVAMVGLGLFALAARGVTDPDLWWHLRTGQLILGNHAVFHADPYSFTRLGQPWVNHEWLSDVFIFALYRVFGWGGLIVAFSAITAAAFLLVFLRCPGRPAIAAVATIWAGVASIPLWGVRPQTLSLLLISVFLLILDCSLKDDPLQKDDSPRPDDSRNKGAAGDDLSAKRSNLLWWIPPLMLLWVNLHAAYAAGIGLVGLFLVGHALDYAFGFEPWVRAGPRIRRLASVLGVSLAVIPLNPNGSKMFWYPVATLRSPAMQRHIAEWFSPDFHQPQYWAALAMILASLLAVALSPRRVLPRELLLLFTTMYMGLHSVRHLAIYVLVTAPILGGLADAWAGNSAAFDRHDPPGRSEVAVAPGKMKIRIWLNAILLAALLAFALARVHFVVGRQAETEAARFPEAAVAFLSTHRPPGPLFNYYDWGGYLIWKLYPGVPVYIDGRADLYGDAFMDSFAQTYDLTNHWEAPLEAWQIRTVMVPPSAPLATALGSRAGWRQIYSDPQAVILTESISTFGQSTRK
jgi:hypothetical protein